MIQWLVYSMILLNVFTFTGWLYLVQFNFRFKRKFFGFSCIGFCIYFLGNSFLTFDSYIILNQAIHPAMLTMRIIITLFASFGTAVFVYRSNFDLIR